MTALQASIGALNDVVDAPRDARPQARQADPGRARVAPRSAWAVVAVAARRWAGPVDPVGRGDRSALAVVVLAIGYGYDLVFKGTAWSWLPFAVGIPLLPVFGWLGTTGGLPGLVRDPAPRRRHRRRRAGHRQRPGRCRARHRGRRRSRSRRGWDSSGRGPSTPALLGRRRRPGDRDAGGPRAHRRPPSLGAVGAGLVVGLGVGLGRRADSARRERAWELEAVGVGVCWPRPGWPGRRSVSSPRRRSGPARSRSRAGAWRSSGTWPGSPGPWRRSSRAARRCSGRRRVPRRHRPGSAWR